MDTDHLALLMVHLARHGSPSRVPPPATDVVLSGSLQQLTDAGMPADEAEQLVRVRASRRVRTELETCAAAGIRVVLARDDAFPPDLRDHPDRPLALWIQGAGIAPAPRVGIVGSREASAPMIAFARRLGRACARAGLAVVSGMARGIDAAALAGALSARGRCIAVVGCGLDVEYPKATWELRQDVVKTGAVVTTYPIGTPPEKFRFPERNRVIAGLSEVVVVVQASERSGALSTARAALDAGGTVLAVPGALDDPLARGTNLLLRDGAGPVLEPRDVIEAVLGVGDRTFDDDEPVIAPVVAPCDQPIVDAIVAGVDTLDALADVTGIPIASLTERIVLLELDGTLIRQPGAVFRLRK
ncbi:MAG: DNA-protecting protein DprA [Planctomycetes bacterium]|nr:DNA-protecting protein DprA [Planctomycetota bacterium]MCC7172189.1 DNA-protecting protein DprA [Planctomycetota bacterium]